MEVVRGVRCSLKGEEAGRDCYMLLHTVTQLLHELLLKKRGEAGRCAGREWKGGREKKGWSERERKRERERNRGGRAEGRVVGLLHAVTRRERMGAWANCSLLTGGSRSASTRARRSW